MNKRIFGNICGMNIIEHMISYMCIDSTPPLPISSVHYRFLVTLVLFETILFP